MKLKTVKSLFEDSAYGDGQDKVDMDKLCIHIIAQRTVPQ